VEWIGSATVEEGIRTTIGVGARELAREGADGSP